MSYRGKWFAISLAFVSSSIVIAAQARRPILGKLALVQELVRAAFPELSGRQFRLRITIDDDLDRDFEATGLVGMSVRPRSDAFHHGTPAETRDPILGGLLLVRLADGYIETADFSGEHVHSTELDALRKAIRNNSTWTEADITSQLGSLHAKYGPSQRARFVTDLKLERFNRVCGPMIDYDARFAWRMGTNLPRNEDIMTPQWLVGLRTKDAMNRAMCYYLSFEPIDGRLVRLSGQPCD